MSVSLISPGQLAKTFVNTASASSPAAFVTRQVALHGGYQTIAQLGKAMGLSPSQIKLAQSAFAGSAGAPHQSFSSLQHAVRQMAHEFNVSQREADQKNQELQDTIDKLVSHMADGEDQKGARAGGKGGSGQSWLMALAEALGKKLDKMADDMSSMADQMTDKTPSMTAKFGAKSQEFGILMNAATNAIKTVGEAEANSARKG